MWKSTSNKKPSVAAKKGGDALSEQLTGLAVPFAFLLAKQGIEAMKKKRATRRQSGGIFGLGTSSLDAVALEDQSKELQAQIQHKMDRLHKLQNKISTLTSEIAKASPKTRDNKKNMTIASERAAESEETLRSMKTELGKLQGLANTISDNIEALQDKKMAINVKQELQREKAKTKTYKPEEISGDNETIGGKKRRAAKKVK